MEPHDGDDQTAVDFSRIQEMSDGDREFERELLEVFLEDCGDRLQRLTAALAAGRLDEAKREAHTIKGAGANVGTIRLQAIATRLEALGDDSASEAHALLEQLTAEFQGVKFAMDKYLQAF